MQRPLEQYGWVKICRKTYRKIVENKGITEIAFRDGKVEIQGEIDTLEELLALYNTAKQIKDESEEEDK